MNDSNNIIFFDGICNLCNRSVNLIIKLDKSAKFKFATLQSESGKNRLKPFNLREDLVSFIYIENGKVHDQSTAILKIGKKLGGIWAISYVFILIPKFIRDTIYQMIARNRYKWFGKREQCRLPELGIQERFI